MKKIFITGLLSLAFCLTLFSQNNIFWQNPLPTGNDISGVFAADSMNVIAVGSPGIIMKSSNGGFNWNNILPGFYSLNVLNDAFFINSSTGWVFGGTYNTNSGFIMKTTNGGANWNEQNSGQPNQFLSGCFINSNTGWVSGVDGIISKTTNGGANWFSLSSGVTSLIFSIKFLNDNTGWFGNHNDLYRTTNGGLNWSLQSTVDVLDISFSDGNTGWAGGGSDFIKTSNGGLNWSSPQGFPFITFGTIKKMIAKNYTECYVLTAGGYIVRTTNGGISWLGLFNTVNNEQMQDFTFIGSNAITAFSGYGKNHRSSNSGSNWVTQYSSITNKHLNSVFFVNDNTGWASGNQTFNDSTVLVKTTNGGNNWFLQNISITGKAAMFFTDNLTGYVSGFDGYIRKTTNGGSNWFLQNPGNPYSIIYTSYFHNNSTGYFAGYEKIYKTTNQGVNWNAIIDFPGIDFTSIHGINQDTLYAVTYQGYIYKITGTNQYSLINSEPSVSFSSIRFINSNTGIAAGTQGKIFRTTNGGNNWNDVSIPYNYDVTAVNFADPLNVFVTCDGFGIILKSTNSGSNWSLITACPSGLTDIFVRNNGLFWAVGKNGTIVKMENLVTPVISNGNNTPGQFELSQNYPNPFNPVTKINYDLPKDSKVKIVIYDILGREVKRLVNNELNTAGFYIVDFNASNYASGVYFYRIEAYEPNGNKFVDSKKMVLIK